MHARVRAGRLSAPDEDDQARRYRHADAVLSAAGLRWYEISNWAAGDAARCRHNLGYWTGGHWWPVGPGAHGHIAGTRFWTLRHPAVHAGAVAEGRVPVDGHERIDADAAWLERLMLGLRLHEGLPLDDLPREPARHLVADGLLEVHAGRARLTLAGRRLADGVIRTLA
jgi:oxygen-independent coproporphyrinogen-3 oxidase